MGIDRVWGSAAESIKYDRAVLPSGTSLPLGLTVDIAGRRRAKDEKQSETPEAFAARVQRTQAMLGHLLAALDQGQMTFGAARTRGLGRVVCTLERVLHQQLDSRAGIFAVLHGCGTAVSVQELCAADPVTQPQRQPRLNIAIRWQPRGPLMVKAGYDGVGVDIVPLVSATANGMALVLPGSSIKGALRSQAERIVRTVLGRRASVDHQPRQQFLKQLEEVPLIRELFGSRAQSQTPQASATAPQDTSPLPGLGALAVEDCYARDSMLPEHWRAVITASAAADQSYEQQELWKALNTLERVSSGRYTVAHHVAIDRWTGGAADGMLFSVLAPEAMAWQDICLRLDLGRLPEALRVPGLMLLLLTLRDLLQSRLPLGFATNRGMGELDVVECHLQGTALDTLGLAGLDDLRLSEPGLRTLDASLRERLTQEWQTWITQKAAGGTA